MMKYFKIALLLFLASCVEVEFTKPMPPNKGTTLQKLPKEITAYFMNLEKDGEKLNLNEVNSDFKWNDPLPSDVVLKKWKGNYYFNQQNDDNWQLILVKKDPSKIFNVYHLDGGNEATLNTLKSLTDVEETFDEDGDLSSVLLNPSLKEFKKMLKSDAFVKVDLFED